METSTMKTKGASLVSHVCYVRIISVAHFWTFNISMSLFCTRRQILKCFCVLVLKEPLVHFVVCLCSGRHRWVIYTTEMNGKKTLWEVDGSMVPAEW